MVNKDQFFKSCLAALMLASAAVATAVTPATRLAAPARAHQAEDAERYETILYEDFGKWEAGSPEVPDETMYPENYFNDYDDTLPADMFMNDGSYRGCGCYQAGGCLALNYPGMGGFVNFPSMQMGGKLIVTARVKAIGEKNTSFSIVILTGDAASPVSVENDGGFNGMMTITNADGWIDIRREIINPYSDPCWLQVNAMMYNPTGIVVDYVKVERDLSYLTAPSFTGATQFANNGFTGYWQQDPRADSYMVSLYEKTPLTGDDGRIYEDFEDAAFSMFSGELTLKEGVTATVGFSLDGALATEAETPDDVFEGKQSVRLHNNDRLSLFLDNTLIKDISMAFMTNADTSNKNVDLRVIPFTKYNPGDNEYAFYWMLKPGNLDEGWNWVEMSKTFDDFAGGYTRVDLIPEGLKDGEYMIIDNLCALTEPFTETKCVVEDAPAADNSYAFTGLDMAKTYYFTVKAKNSVSTSEASAQTYAIGVGAPMVKEATDLDKRGAFTANWEPAVNATSYTLNCYESRLVTDESLDYTVFSEDFSKAKGGDEGKFLFLENMYSIELDSFADHEGWGGSGTLVGDGMVGCYMMEVYGQKMPFEMFSPAMDLSHDGGKFKVDVDFMVQDEGEALIIQCDNTSYIGIQGAEAGQLAHASVELTGGTANSKLMFYALGSTPFMLDKVEVSQTYTKGDEMLTKVDFKEIADGTAASGRISGLERKDDIKYAYELISHRDHYGLVYSSEPSEKMHVDLYPDSIESVGLPESGNYRIFDFEGREIKGAPAPGIYIVLKEGKAYKTIVK